MPVTLGSVSFDAQTTVVRETHEEVGGRRERVIEISGVVTNQPDEAAIHAALDAILASSSTEDYSGELSLRPGRRLWVRRNEFVRDVSACALTGAFRLKLGARDPFEESTELHSVDWPITESGAQIEVSTEGNAPAPLSIRLVANDTIVNPSFTDGVVTISYPGTLAAGEVLLLDGIASAATWNGIDVLPYVLGAFLAIDPLGNTMTYNDDAASSHNASVTLEYRDRWW